MAAAVLVLSALTEAQPFALGRESNDLLRNEGMVTAAPLAMLLDKFKDKKKSSDPTNDKAGSHNARLAEADTYYGFGYGNGYFYGRKRSAEAGHGHVAYGYGKREAVDKNKVKHGLKGKNLSAKPGQYMGLGYLSKD